MTASAAPTSPDPTWQTEAFARFVRLFALGATLLYPIVGVASATSAPSVRLMVGIVAFGVFFHVSGAIANDVCDIEIDRGDPRRARGPLILGMISPQMALGLSLTLLAPMYLIIALLDNGGTAAVVLAAGAVLGTLYNVAGKVLPVPLVADVVQGVAWGAVVIVGAELATGQVWPASVWAMGFVVVYIAMANGVLGAIRDVENDRASGARTTAILLGARIDDGRILLPGRLRSYAVGLELLLTALLAAPLLDALRTGVGLRLLVTVVATAIIHAGAIAALVGAFIARNDLGLAMARGTWWLFLTPAALLTSVAWRLPAWAAAVAVVCFLAPPKLYDVAVRGTDFTLPSTSASMRKPERAPWMVQLGALWEASRPGVWIASAALVAVGAILGGAILPDVFAAMAAAGLVVFAADIFNDRCDVPSDAINRPDRPIPSGRLSGNVADKTVLLTSVGGVAAAALISAEAAAAAGVLLVVSLAYSLVLRRVAVAGHLTAAGLFAASLLYGAAFASDGVGVAHWVSALLIVVFLFARESLKAVPDVLGDRAAGYRTIATEFGSAAAIVVFRISAFVFLALAITASIRGSGGIVGLAALSLLVVAPVVLALWEMRGTPDGKAIEASLRITGLVFAGGTVALLLV